MAMPPDHAYCQAGQPTIRKQGAGGPAPSVGANVSLTGFPIAMASNGVATILVSIVGPSASLT